MSETGSLMVSGLVTRTVCCWVEKDHGGPDKWEVNCDEAGFECIGVPGLFDTREAALERALEHLKGEHDCYGVQSEEI